MKIKIIIFIIFIFYPASNLFAGLLINEAAYATSGDDWVELFYFSENNDALNISGYYVTMYYGTNENLSSYPVTIYSYDRPETPYDDRFVVVHLAQQNMEDETDATGDTNNNGCIDIYCNNYYNSLWSSDCVVSIDTDDDPSNGGIIDFLAYSNNDGEINDSIKTYAASAESQGQWAACEAENPQECMFNIGEDGISSFMTISRKTSADTNSPNDFEITKYMTPGRPNIFEGSISSNKKLFRLAKKTITVNPTMPPYNKGDIDVSVFESCNLRLRIFSSIGMLIYESPLYKNISPGRMTLTWDLKGLGKKARTGLYIAHIEAVNNIIKKTQIERIYVILSHYK